MSPCFRPRPVRPQTGRRRWRRSRAGDSAAQRHPDPRAGSTTRGRGSRRRARCSSRRPGTTRRAQDSARSCCRPSGPGSSTPCLQPGRRSAAPVFTRSAANAIAWSPDEQKRLTVIADVDTGSPARSAAIRATFNPCSASGMAQPKITSSISAGSTPGARASASRMTIAASSSGRVVRSAPFGALPTGVLTAETRTASFMTRYPWKSPAGPRALRRLPASWPSNR